MEFIDIHSHYAWGLDDGIASKEEAIEALAIAKKQDITKIVATPHLIPGDASPELIQTLVQRINELKELAKDYQIEIYQGCEVMLSSECLNILEPHNYLNINEGPFTLVEFNVTKELPQNYEDYLYEYNFKTRLIIAHVERYFHQEIDLAIIHNWVQAGYIIQVNTTSFLGYHGETIQNNAYRLLDAGLIHVVANDVHRSSGKRRPNLKDAYLLLEKKYQAEDLAYLFHHNPLALINGTEPTLVKVKKKSKIPWFRRRR